MGENGTNIGIINLGLDINKALFNKQLNGIASGAQKMVTGAFKPIGRMIGGALAVGSVVAFTKSCLDLGSNLSEVQNVVDVTFGSMAGKVNDFADTAIEKFGLSETVAKKMMGTYGAMSKAFGFNPQEVYDMSEAITGLTADVASFYNLETDEAYTKMKSIWTGETETLKDLGVVMTQTALDQYALNEGFGKTTAAMTEQEKVLLRYQFVQSQLSDASGDFARTSDGWANQVRVLTLRFQQLKATLGQGFINLFTPIVKMINTFIAGLQGAANAFLRLTEIITGKESGSLGSVTSDMGDISGAAGDASDNISNIGDSAAGAAKKAQRALMGFDQIQKLSENSSSNGSGGSTGGVSSAGSGAIASELSKANEEASKLEKNLVEMVDKVKKAWQTGDFTEIGEMIGQKINEGLGSIGWDDIKETVKKISKSVATFLNGAIGETDWSLVGGTIAEGINTGVLGIDTFLTTFDWKNAAKAVAETFNGFLNTTDWELIGQTIADGINSITDFLVTLVKEIDFKAAADAVGETFSGFCKNIDMGDAAKVILTVLSTKLALKATKELFEEAGSSISKALAKKLAEKLGVEIGKEAGIGTAIKTGIEKHSELSGIAVKAGITITTAVVGFKIGNWIYENTTFSKFADAVAEWMVNEEGEISITRAITLSLTSLIVSISTSKLLASAAGAVTTALAGGIPVTGVKLAITSVVANIATGAEVVWSGLSGLVSSMGTTICAALKTDLPLLFTEGTFATSATAIVAGFAGAVIAAIGGWNLGNLIYECVTGEDVDDIDWGDYLGKNFHISEWGDAIKQLIIDGAKNWNPIQWIYEAITGKEHQENSGFDFYVNVVGSIDAGAKLIKDWFSEKKEQTKEFFANAKGKVESTFTEMKEKWESVKDSAVTKIADAKEKIPGAIEDLKEKFNSIKDSEAVKKVTGKVDEWFTKTKDTFSKLTSDTAKKTVTGAVDKWFDDAKSKFSKLTSNTAKKTITGTIDKWFDKAKAAFNSVGNKTAKVTAKFKDTASDLKKKGKEMITKIIEGFKSKVLPSFRVTYSTNVSALQKAVYKAFNLPGWPSLHFAAQGGLFGKSGEVVVTRENGAPELVGRYGNKTGVMNNDQIVSSVSQGVRNAVGSSVFQAVKSAMAISIPRMRTPQLAVTSSSSSEDRIMQRILDTLTIISEGEANAEVIATLKEVLVFLKTMDRDVYMDAEKVTKKVEDVINRHTDITGVCPIKT